MRERLDAKKVGEMGSLDKDVVVPDNEANFWPLRSPMYKFLKRKFQTA